MRTHVYVDGFNLYYGALKNTSFKWLDLLALSKNLLKKNDITKIKYFTARIKPRSNDPRQSTRQQVYLRALKTLPECEIIYGHFLSHNVKMPLSSSPGQMVKVIKTEEKGSDINMASHILLDGFQDEFDVAAIISNDSDLLTPIRMVKKNLQKVVGVINPHLKPSVELKREASFYKKIKVTHLKNCQFPETIKDQHGLITKPKSW